MATHITPKNENELNMMDVVLNTMRNATPFGPASARMQQEFLQTHAARERLQNRFNAPVAPIAPVAPPAPKPEVVQAPEPERPGAFFATVTIASEPRVKGNSAFVVAFVKQCETGELPVDGRIAIILNPGTPAPKGSLVRASLLPMMGKDGKIQMAYDMPKFWQGHFWEVRALAGMGKGQKLVARSANGECLHKASNSAGRWAPKSVPKA